MMDDKKIEWLISYMKLCCTQFDLCCEHSELAYKGGRKVKCKNTPARECGIADSKWTLRYLLTFRYLETSTG
jgi:hypothetical protein